MTTGSNGRFRHRLRTAISRRCPRCTAVLTSTARPHRKRITSRKRSRCRPQRRDAPATRRRLRRFAMAHAALTHHDVMQPPPDRAMGSGVYTEKLGMWIFLGSEVMFFTALIGTYIILRIAHPSSWKPPGVVLNVPVTATNTFLLICSSVTMVKAFAAVQDGLLSALRRWLVATVVIGASFV